MSSPKTFSNRLIHEKSPYLLQHAHNPVDWYPWGEEAFTKAKKEDKPIFLSIGYSTCHWCHVMEEESFEDETIAKTINENFIPIKVDREERPDIDQAYMSAVTAMNSQGGWPLSVFLTPDKKPFFGGTYFPPYAKWGQPGLIDLLQSIHQSWNTRREEVIESSQGLIEFLKQSKISVENPHTLDKKIFHHSYEQYARNFDSRDGGFGQAPKFPSSHNLSFLLRYWKRTQENKALAMVDLTLTKMAQGGMYDQIGGGFHRYSTDQQWQIPHFEKMLYDQANLALTYLEAYQATKNKFYATIAREIFEYVLRDLQHNDGGFYSAEDADSLDPESSQGKKKEGAFYVWTQGELHTILEKKEQDTFDYHFGIEENGNAQYDPHGEFVGKNIIYIKHTLEETAAHFHKTIDEISEILNIAKKKIFNARQKRDRPHLDDKILVDWNGFMIAALSFGGKVLGDEHLTQAAKRATGFIERHLISPQGRLLHRYRDGEAAILGTLNDYAYFVFGLLETYEADGKIEYLELAIQLTDEMVRLFWDHENGGFYLTGADAEEILFRQKEIYDGAMPSGNAIAALNVVRLSQISSDKKYEGILKKFFEAFASSITMYPSAYAQMLIAFDFVLGPSMEIVMVSNKEKEPWKDWIKKIYEDFNPYKILIYYPGGRNDAKKISEIAPFVKEQKAIDSRPTVYVCQNHVCRSPVQEIPQLESLIKKLEWDWN